jgi:hypothetical protein
MLKAVISTFSVVALILCASPQTHAKQPSSSTLVAAKSDKKKPQIVKLKGWRLETDGARRTSSISTGIDTYSAKEGFSFYEIGFELVASAAKSKSLTIDLRSLSLEDDKGNVFHSEAILLPSSASAYFYGPMLDGKLSPKYRCSSAISGSCSPLIGGKAQVEVGGVVMAFEVTDQTATATLTPPAGEKLVLRIAFYLPNAVGRVKLRWPGKRALSLEVAN